MGHELGLKSRPDLQVEVGVGSQVTSWELVLNQGRSEFDFLTLNWDS